ncbi:hypothetical protein OPQ81_001388 [Rhizoctonia solani]|nr:hypothetical protein OPQ81_001388 [Rhizoctonia solani]
MGNRFPVYYDGGTVQGSVQIRLESPQTIRSVVVEVEGTLHLLSAYDTPPLWHEKRKLWDSSGNFEPQSIRSSGEWSWDFSFPIPTHFDNTANGGSPRTKLPGNFSLKPYTGFMQYRVLLFVKRGKYLIDLVELQTLFFIPYYQGNTPPGPESDPDGWKPCDVIHAKGIVFGNREVSLVYRPFLANPTTYPRGGAIFYRIGVSGSDSQALGLLSSPAAITVLLVREIGCKLHRDAHDANVHAIAQGVSWTIVSLEGESDTKFLEGEIAIPPGTCSSTTVAPIQVNDLPHIIEAL